MPGSVGIMAGVKPITDNRGERCIEQSLIRDHTLSVYVLTKCNVLFVVSS